jgi:hypothetical protein
LFSYRALVTLHALLFSDAYAALLALWPLWSFGTHRP